MRIGARIGIGFAAVVLVTGVLGAAGWLGLERYARSVANADRMVAVADLARSAGSDIDAYQARRNSDRIGEAQAKLTSAREAAAAEGLDQVVASIARMEGAFGTLVDHTRSVEAARGTLLAGIAEMEALAATVQAHEEKHHAELMRRRDDAAAEQLR
ncbi:MAG TPA: hypothetical protein VIR38_04070, partial [Thalassobaculum sp.]